MRPRRRSGRMGPVATPPGRPGSRAAPHRSHRRDSHPTENRQTFKRRSRARRRATPPGARPRSAFSSGAWRCLRWKPPAARPFPSPFPRQPPEGAEKTPCPDPATCSTKSSPTSFGSLTKTRPRRAVPMTGRNTSSGARSATTSIPEVLCSIAHSTHALTDSRHIGSTSGNFTRRQCGSMWHRSRKTAPCASALPECSTIGFQPDLPIYPSMLFFPLCSHAAVVAQTLVRQSRET